MMMIMVVVVIMMMMVNQHIPTSQNPTMRGGIMMTFFIAHAFLSSIA